MQGAQTDPRSMGTGQGPNNVANTAMAHHDRRILSFIKYLAPLTRIVYNPSSTIAKGRGV